MRSSWIFCIPALIAPLGAAQAAKAPAAFHKVKAGETAAKIARTHNLSLSRLAELNPKLQLSKLTKGMTLRLAGPVRAAALDPVAAEAPETLSARQEPLAPMPSLPLIPSAAPSTLIHLERVLPDTPQRTPLPAGASLSPQSSTSTLTLLQPVFLPSPGLEYESLVAANLGF